jgi:CheY-like chemotaxis protein
LRQVLLNLVSNAIKFTPCGEVVVRARLVAAESDRTMVRLEVADTGVGFDPATAERLFEPFRQADASTTRRYGGTGLGLAICRRLAGAMGGNVGAESRPGQGSTFWLDIPLGPATPPAQAPDLSGRALDGLRVLIVDDNETNRQVLRAQLSGWGVAADVAADAPIALALLRSAAAEGRPHDLALLDMTMPGTDGMELGRMIAADPKLGSVRLVLVSSVPIGEEATARAGFSARLSKPVRLSQLRDALQQALAPALQSRPVPPTPEPPSPDGPRRRLLIVEDNAINKMVATATVRQLGYASDGAGNGFEALDALGRCHYDAVLMDCQMPEMDGFEATAEIRRREAGTRCVPIIAMTAGASADDRERCLAAGMDDYVSKPVHITDLDQVLRRWVAHDDQSDAGAAVSARTS